MSQRDTKWSLLPSSSQAEESQHGVVEEDSGVWVCVENIVMVSLSQARNKASLQVRDKEGGRYSLGSGWG